MKKIVLIIILLPFVFLPYQIKAEDNKFVIGINSGYSFGLTDEYKEEMYIWPEGRGSFKEQRKLNFHIRGDLQYYLSPHWAIQFELEFQKRTRYMEEVDNLNSTYIYETQDQSFFYSYINVIYKINSFRQRNFFPYVSAGIGIGIIAFRKPLFFAYKYKLQGGIKYRFSEQISLNLGSSIYATNFANPIKPVGKAQIDYISLNIGLEYGF